MIVRSCMRTQVGREHTLSGWLGSSSTSPPLWLPQGYSISPAARSPDFPRYEEEPPPTRAAIARHSEGEQPSAVLSSMSTQSGSCTGRSGPLPTPQTPLRRGDSRSPMQRTPTNTNTQNSRFSSGQAYQHRLHLPVTPRGDIVRRRSSAVVAADHRGMWSSISRGGDLPSDREAASSAALTADSCSGPIDVSPVREGGCPSPEGRRPSYSSGCLSSLSACMRTWDQAVATPLVASGSTGASGGGGGGVQGFGGQPVAGPSHYERGRSLRPPVPDFARGRSESPFYMGAL